MSDRRHPTGGRRLAAAAVLLAALSPGPALASTQEQDTAAAVTPLADTAAVQDRAVDAARAWLKLVDAGEIAASWEQGAEAFRQAVTKENWIRAVQQARGPLEPFGERTLLGSTYRTEIPNAPSGHYVIIQFRTTVAGDRTVTETVVPMLDPDDTWRVSGYFVRPQ